MIRTNHQVALYARFSSDNQRTESIDAQRRAMHTYCRQHNFTIVETYIDEAKSATSDRRPAFQQMIADSAKKTFDILLVHKLDRFARNRYDSAIYKRELRKNGVSIYSVLENLDNSPESIMLESVLNGMSEYYSHNLSREVMKGLKENALQCKHTGGRPPLGYDIDPVTRKMVINETEAEAVRLIYTMYGDGYGYTDILVELHKRGLKTKLGADFAKNSLHSILNNKKYSGTYIYNRSSPKNEDGSRNSHRSKPQEEIITIPGGCPRIVDDLTCRKVQRRIEENRRAGAGARNNAKQQYLLTGKLYCKECGRSMIASKRYYAKRDYFYFTYRCPTKKHLCSNKEINLEYLEAHVVRLLEKHIFNTAAMKRIMRKIDRQQDGNTLEAVTKRNRLESQLAETQTSLQRIADAIADGLISSALIERLDTLEAEKTALEAQLSQIDHPGNTDSPIIDPLLIPSQYGELRKKPELPAYKVFLQTFIERIDVGRYTVSVTLKTGLELFDCLDTTITTRQEEIYRQGMSSHT